MFIVLRKKIIKRYLFLAIGLMFLSQTLIFSVPAQAAENLPPEKISFDELKQEGFNDNELKSMGFVRGMGKVIIYNARQKQIWEARVEKARERVSVARQTNKKPNPKDLYLLDRDKQIKNPPKKPFREKWFGTTTAQFIDYFKSGKNPPDAKIVFGDGLTAASLILFLKALAPLAL